MAGHGIGIDQSGQPLPCAHRAATPQISREIALQSALSHVGQHPLRIDGQVEPMTARPLPSGSGERGASLTREAAALVIRKVGAALDQRRVGGLRHHAAKPVGKRITITASPGIVGRDIGSHTEVTGPPREVTGRLAGRARDLDFPNFHRTAALVATDHQLVTAKLRAGASGLLDFDPLTSHSIGLFRSAPSTPLRVSLRPPSRSLRTK